MYVKKIFLLFILLGLISCHSSNVYDGLVSIQGIQGEKVVVEGMGVCIDDGRILSSSHVVGDDRIEYTIGNQRYDVMQRYPLTDIVWLRRQDGSGCDTSRAYVGKLPSLRVGDGVMVPVVRSGSILALTGTITSLAEQVVAYDQFGRTRIFSGILMTDINFLPGDSGAPVLDEQGRVIDVVHVAK